MNILGVFIITLSWGFIRATTYSKSWTGNQNYHQLSGVPDRPIAYQHLSSQESAYVPEEQRFYQNRFENNHSTQIAQAAPIEHYESLNSIPFRPQFNGESYSLTSVNEPYNLPHQNQIKEFASPANSGLRIVQNIPVIQEPFRQNVELRDIVSPKSQYIQQTPESISYPERNQEVSNTPLRQNLGLQHIFSNPKIREILHTAEPKRRYMIIYPNGSVSHVDNVDDILKSNPQYVFINSKELYQNGIHSNYLRQTENKQETNIKEEKIQEANKKGSEGQSLKKIAGEQNVTQNPIDLILNETNNANKPKTPEVVEPTKVIVLQSLGGKQNNQIKPVHQSSSITNKIVIFEQKSDGTQDKDLNNNTLTQIGSHQNLKNIESNDSFNETFVTLNTTNTHPYIDSIIKEEKYKNLNKTSVGQNSTKQNDDSSDESFVTLNTSYIHPFTDSMIREEKLKRLNDTNVGQNLTSQNNASSIENFATLNTSYIQPYTDSMIREEKNKSLNKANVGQNLTKQNNHYLNVTTADTSNAQPHSNKADEEEQNNSGIFTKTITNANETSKYNNKTTKPNIGPVNPIDIISPVLNNTAETNTINKTKQIPEQKTDKPSSNDKNITNASVNKTSNNNSTSNISEDQSESRSPTSNPTKPSEGNDDKNKTNLSSLRQSTTEKQIEQVYSTNTSEEFQHKTQVNTDLENESSNQNETDYSSESATSASSEEFDSTYDYFDFEKTSIYSSEGASSEHYPPEDQGQVTSQDGQVWKNVSIQNESFDVVSAFDLPLQPITIVDSNGESHACLRLLDPTALLTYIICK